MKLNQSLKTITTAAVLTILFSCQKEMVEKNEPVASDALFPQTFQQKQTVAVLKEVATILETVYQNPKALYEVNAAIYSGYYEDETVLLKDLLFPEKSELYKTKKFKDFRALTGIFKERFNEALIAGDYTELKKAMGLSTIITNSRETSVISTDTSMQIYSNSNGVAIYFPYSENFGDIFTPSYFDNINSEPQGEKATIVAADRDADSGPGMRPFICNTRDNMQLCYRNVTVNDAYAETNVTHIVGVGAEPSGTTIDRPAEAFPPQGPIDLPNYPREVKQVYVGDVRINRKQFDKFISFTGNGGGSEIRFTRADGFLKLADGQVQADNYLIGDRKSIKRKEINRASWVGFNLEWDGDWELDNLQQNLAIYEDDNRNSGTISGTIGTTLTALVPPFTSTITGSIGFSISYKSDDAIIKQTNYNRDVFFILNRTNLEGEIYKSWPVRDRYANVSFTLNDRSYF